MKPSVYIETTIPSYYTARPSRDVVVAGHQVTTQEWWDTRAAEFRLFISSVVLEEAGAGNAELAQKRLELLKPCVVLEVGERVTKLADRFLKDGSVPPNEVRDALHMAAAAVHGMNFLLTWNCTHIANRQINDKVKGICREEGLACPTICTPDYLV